MAFCKHCGNQLEEASRFCPKCGAGVEQQAQQPNQSTAPGAYQVPYQAYQGAYQAPYQAYQTPYQQPMGVYPPPQNVVQQLSKKLKTEAIIWLVVACLQYLLVLVYFFIGVEEWGYGGGAFLVNAVLLLGIAIYNTVFCVRNFNYSHEVLKAPVGIVNTHRPVGRYIGNLIYNILFGGLVGIVGAIYAFVVRSFVLNHEYYFIQIEQQFMASQAQQNK